MGNASCKGSTSSSRKIRIKRLSKDDEYLDYSQQYIDNLKSENNIDNNKNKDIKINDIAIWFQLQMDDESGSVVIYLKAVEFFAAVGVNQENCLMLNDLQIYKTIVNKMEKSEDEVRIQEYGTTALMNYVVYVKNRDDGLNIDIVKVILKAMRKFKFNKYIQHHGFIILYILLKEVDILQDSVYCNDIFEVLEQVVDHFRNMTIKIDDVDYTVDKIEELLKKDHKKKRLDALEIEIKKKEEEINLLKSSIINYKNNNNNNSQGQLSETTTAETGAGSSSSTTSPSTATIASETAMSEQEIKDTEEKLKELNLEREDLVELFNDECNDDNGLCLFPERVIPTASQLNSSRGGSGGTGGAPSLDLIKIPQALRMKANRCALLNEIGDGGFSSVFKIKMKKRRYDSSKSDIFAFKKFGISTIAIKQSEVDMIESEVLLLSQLSHENVIKILGVIGDPNAKDVNGEKMGIGIVMEYCENGSLRNLLNRTGSPLSMNLIIHLLFGAAQGLEYLHNHEPNPIIHGDIKSDNILIDSEFNAKLCDFGISKLMLTTMVSTKGGGNLGGTTSYKAPESFNGKLELKSDVYSFGCVILEMLTGEKPWDALGGDITLIITKVLVAKEQHDLSKIRKDARKDLIDLMKRCLDYDKDKRPTIQDVRTELEKMINNGVLIRLDAETDEYKNVEKLFFPGCSNEGSLTKTNYQIVKIEKMRHIFAEGLYNVELKKIHAMVSKPIPGEIVTSNSKSEIIGANEKLLFHGTSKSNPMEILNHPDAFMKDYSREGFYGRGLYFAELARYSNSGYRYNIPNTKQYQLLVCSVICGRPKEYGVTVNGKTKASTQKDLGTKYHSVHAGPHRPGLDGPGLDDSCMYIVYKDTQVVARYLITYEEIKVRESGLETNAR